MKRQFCLLALVLVAASALAQETVSKVGFRHIESSAIQEKGYRGFYEGGLFAKDCHDFSVMTSHGYMFSPYVFAGAGVGYQHVWNDKTGLLPLFGELRAYAVTGDGRAFIPYAGVKAGYNLPFGVSEGFFMAPQVGIEIGLFKHVGLDLAVEYAYNDVSRTRKDFQYNFRRSYNSFAFKLGITIWE